MEVGIFSFAYCIVLLVRFTQFWNQDIAAKAVRNRPREAALCKIKERIKKTKDEKKAKKVDFFHQARICSLWFTFQVDCFHALRMSDLL
ncbi:hypothetical protein MKW98_030233, partial [Papaver atlanticum]